MIDNDISNDLISRKRNYKKYFIALFPLILLLVIILIYINNSETEVDISEAIIVESGNFDIWVDGFGRFKSQDERVLASSVSGVVQDIYLRPGSNVDADTEILLIKNKEVEAQLIDARSQYAQAKLSLESRKIELQLEINKLEIDIAEIKGNLDFLSIKVAAMKESYQSGTVAHIDYLENKHLKAKIENLYGLKQERLSKVNNSHKLLLDIHKQRIEQFREDLVFQQDVQSSLLIKANANGVLQNLNVVAGQAVEAGTELAKVGSSDSLYVEFLIAQRDASSLQLGQIALLDTQGVQIEAYVSNIEPKVTDGRVRIELALVNPPPPNIRPELSVQGKIKVSSISKTLYVRSLPGIAENTRRTVLKVNKENTNKKLVDVSFGERSNGYIQILDGANEDDLIILQ